jgi:hypothetical protein
VYGWVHGSTATSSFWIVPWPWPSETVAPVTFVTLTRKVSSGSTSVSPFTSTSNVELVAVAGIVWPVSERAV